MNFTKKDIEKSAVANLNKHLFEDKEVKKAKYGNEKTDFDGHVFDSKKELHRYITLRMLLNAGEITDLQCQVEFILEAGHKKVCKYVADFTYTDKDGKMIVEDVKSKITRRLAVYRLKKKLMLNCLGIEIKEV